MLFKKIYEERVIEGVKPVLGYKLLIILGYYRLIIRFFSNILVVYAR